MSWTDILKNLLIAQNPESFGSDNPIPPAHIAIAHNTGETELATIVPPNIDAVVISATVVEPCAQRIICDIKKQSSNIGILNCDNETAI